jgi:hypothetical protein
MPEARSGHVILGVNDTFCMVRILDVTVRFIGTGG